MINNMKKYVEMNKIKFGKQKFHHGHIKKNNEFCNVKHYLTKVFIVTVSNHIALTLKNIIVWYVKPMKTSDY